MSLRRRRRQRLVRIKVQKLKSIVPGGHGLQLDSLFVHTASYILRLRLQVYEHKRQPVKFTGNYMQLPFSSFCTSCEFLQRRLWNFSL
ncbi:hypothetical protein CMV_026047 [Castanea mollissima]|uniref:Uncharacterized protein n=1 Tax=Castanea mollissima TaxID=60419 RepID=A0A8J4QID7_9ROSI|nr:hypothetical protein CMV_026047 [Castanea mollissima]